MKRIIKILKYSLFSLFMIFLILVSGTLIFQDKITGMFIIEINKKIGTDIEVEKVRFSLLKAFPKASVEFRNIKIEPAPVNLSNGEDASNNLLEAEHLFASFDVRDIIKRRYSIEKIFIRNSSIFLYTDTCGNSNFVIWKSVKHDSLSSVTINLQNIRLEQSSLIYINSKNDLLVDCFVENASGRLSLGDGSTEMKADIGFNLNNFSSSGKILLKNAPETNINGSFLFSSDSLLFNDISLSVMKQVIGVKGALSKNQGTLNLQVEVHNPNIEVIKELVPGMSRIPADLDVSSLQSDISLNLKSLRESFSIIINPFGLKYKGSSGESSLVFRNMDRPYIDLTYNGTLDIGTLVKHYSIKHLEEASGIIRTNARFFGTLNSLNNITRDDLLALNRSVNLHLINNGLKFNQVEKPFNNICGNIMFGQNAWIDGLSFNFAGENVVLNGRIDSLNNIIGSDSGKISLTAGLWTDKFDLNRVMSLVKGSGENQSGKKSKLQDKLTAQINISVDSLVINKFRASQFDGILNYKNGFFNVHSFNILALEGAISGNAALIKKASDGYLARGWFDISEIDVNSAFSVFNNFGQKHLVSDNIKGELTGSISISTETDLHFKPLIPTLSVSGNYTIHNGELIGFEPIRKLSRFIEISELEDIRFQELSNDIIISESRLLIPTMEIKSSAFNISLSGEQSFSGDYEYHLRLLLSDLLSKRAKKSAGYIGEFGPVEDDGLGRTTLFLKLEKGADGTKVSSDLKTLSEEIRSDLMVEKQVLKTILKEEYGWYKQDSTSLPSKESSKKFKIVWEEADSIKTVNPPEKTPLPGIFKKLIKNNKSVEQVNDSIIKKH